jgi:hypothetical protein
VDSGSAAHRHSVSKTRVNALVALRGIPGTQPKAHLKSEQFATNRSCE